MYLARQFMFFLLLGMFTCGGGVKTLKITTTAPLPSATVGKSYALQFNASGGTPPYVWSATGVPAGMSMTTSGLLSGTATLKGNYTIDVIVTDAEGMSEKTTILIGLNDHTGDSKFAK